ncbi:MAG: pyruvate carboxylase [Planctomycetota bacterium]
MGFQKLMVANRGEIAIRVFRACTEMGIRTVAVHSQEDRLSLFRYKADEAYLVGQGLTPVGAYLDIPGLVAVARRSGAQAVHPGYGFLSENAEFARAVAAAGLTFVGPSPKVLETLGDKVAARIEAERLGINVVPNNARALETEDELREVVKKVGFPLILKAAGGGGGRGMAVVRREEELRGHWERCRAESLKAFGKAQVFAERFVEKPKHIEVQILGDAKGNLVHLWERDCSVQRRFQKVVETAPCRGVKPEVLAEIREAALKLGKAVGYTNAGTVEFLVETGGAQRWYFIEANPRLQVEHTVTEWITGVDLVQAQIRIAEGATLADLGLGKQENIPCRGYSIQCRINAEDPSHDFAPQTGRITAWRSAAGMGVRLDSGGGDVNFEILPHYDSLLCKVSTWSERFEPAAAKMDRALSEFRIRGVRTNIPFLQNVVRNASFREGNISTAFLDETPALFQFPPRLDRASKILYFLGSTHLEKRGTVARRGVRVNPGLPPASEGEGSREMFKSLGRETFLRRIRDDNRLWLTDTTLRDAHQSLIATRLRTRDMLPTLPWLNALPFFSLEVWGGATFDVAYRFLKECPWDRLERIRSACPRPLLQMLLRGSNVLGYRNQPDNLIRAFIREAARGGVDVFRCFDALNDTENLKVALESVREEGGIAEATLCYTGDVADPARKNYPLSYYVDLAGRLQAMGADMIAIKDMAGLLTPRAAKILVTALRQAVPVPVHLHTHDTSSMGGATLLAASEAGVDVVDVAMGPFSGLTSQPNLGSLCANLRGTPRDTLVDAKALAPLESYLQGVREDYAEYESGLKSGSSLVYFHEIPGGQYSNLLPQAKALGLESRWLEVLTAYHDANLLMGDPVKVTPTSKAVGDMALFMMSQNLTPRDVAEGEGDLAWPASVKDFFMGMMGRPHLGYPEKLRKRVLGGEKPIEGRPGAMLPPADFELARKELNELLGRPALEREVMAHLLFPPVFRDFTKHQHRFGDTSILDTHLFFHGVALGKEVQVEIERGKTLIVKLLAIGEPDAKGERPFHFELNGFPRVLTIRDERIASKTPERRKAVKGREAESGSPVPGKVSKVLVEAGMKVAKGRGLFVVEAMKMETQVSAKVDGTVSEILLKAGDPVESGDLVVVLAP